MYFKKRVSEGESMTRDEVKTFEMISNKRSKVWNNLIIDHISQFLKPFKNIKVLEIGCGPGLLLKDIYLKYKRFNPEIIGLEKFDEVIGIANKNLSDFKKFITLIKGDVHKLPFLSDYFNLIVCKDSLHHFKNLKKALKEMYRVLNKNGLIYIQDLRRDVPFYILKTILPPDLPEKKIIYKSVRSSYTIDEIKKVLKQLKITKYKIGIRKMSKDIISKYKIINPSINSLRYTIRSRFFLMIRK